MLVWARDEEGLVEESVEETVEGLELQLSPSEDETTAGQAVSSRTEEEEKQKVAPSEEELCHPTIHPRGAWLVEE